MYANARIHHSLTPGEPIKRALPQREGIQLDNGARRGATGKRTGCSPAGEYAA